MEEKNKVENGFPVEKKPNKTLIIIYVLIVVSLVVGAFVYILMRSNEFENKNELTQAQLDQAYSQLDSMSTELDNRILKIAQLGGEIDTLIAIKNQLEEEKRQFRKRAYRQINDLKSKVSGYKELLVAQDEEIARLKKANEELLVENTGLKNEKNELNESIRELNSRKKDLESKVALASRLKIKGMSILAVNSNGKERESPFRNRHINDLKISFDIIENKVAPIEGKEILVKITAPDGNVIFDVTTGSGTFMFEGREEFYTAKKEILYDRKGQLLVYLYNKGSDYAQGTYQVDVYTDSYKMGSGTFDVK
ncbi:coiled-coil domain-containing protein [Reichenbachiella versicolor]|uniref:coiled-coil domain-containing protein n=1 Tax=Reichenbachiella versicolor TaxID=1821036 RepID=UPI000D6E7E67|nr:chromosome segregation protein SMC [Reichenbachiella versicolor]